MTDPAPYLAALPFTLAPDPGPPPPPPPPVPLVVIYADSFTQGFQWGGVGAGNWTLQVRDRLHVNVANMAIGGTGFVAMLNHSTFPHAAAVWPVHDADLVVIFGGFNDKDSNPEQAELGAVVLLTVLRYANPAAPILLIGPQWPASVPFPVMFTIRDRLRSAVAAVADPLVTYVDPLGWFAGRPEVIGPDGTHPYDTGHRLIADRMVPLIAAALGRGAS